MCSLTSWAEKILKRASSVGEKSAWPLKRRRIHSKDFLAVSTKGRVVESLTSSNSSSQSKIIGHVVEPHQQIDYFLFFSLFIFSSSWLFNFVVICANIWTLYLLSSRLFNFRNESNVLHYQNSMCFRVLDSHSKIFIAPIHPPSGFFLIQQRWPLIWLQDFLVIEGSIQSKSISMTISKMSAPD